MSDFREGLPVIQGFENLRHIRDGAFVSAFDAVDQKGDPIILKIAIPGQNDFLRREAEVLKALAGERGFPNLINQGELYGQGLHNKVWIAETKLKGFKFNEGELRDIPFMDENDFV